MYAMLAASFFFFNRKHVLSMVNGLQNFLATQMLKRCEPCISMQNTISPGSVLIVNLRAVITLTLTNSGNTWALISQSTGSYVLERNRESKCSTSLHTNILYCPKNHIESKRCLTEILKDYQIHYYVQYFNPF